MPMPPHLKWPAYSCFSGATVCLKTIRKNAIEDPRLMPLRLVVRHQELGSPADIGFTIVATPLTLEQVREAGGVNESREGSHQKPYLKSQTSPAAYVLTSDTWPHNYKQFEQ